MVSVDQAYMVGHMKNADGSINNKNVVLSAACEAAELFQCMMSVNQNLCGQWSDDPLWASGSVHVHQLSILAEPFLWIRAMVRKRAV